MLRRLPLLALPLVLLSACSTKLTGSVTGDLEETSQQTVAVAQVQENDPAPLPGFSEKGKFVGVDGEWVRVFEYDSEDAAIADAQKVSADGATIEGNPIAWAGPVHFYRQGQVIAVYVGENAAIMNKLGANGSQFAGTK